jgi:histone H3/H4
LRKIRRMQKFTNLIILRLSFVKIIRDIMTEIDATLKIKKKILEILQKTIEAMMTTKFNNKFEESRLITH